MGMRTQVKNVYFTLDLLFHSKLLDLGLIQDLHRDLVAGDCMGGELDLRNRSGKTVHCGRYLRSGIAYDVLTQVRLGIEECGPRTPKKPKTPIKPAYAFELKYGTKLNKTILDLRPRRV
mmetsp:Transcript_28829/g.42474  ORF Transcript_28829/g.42474 Transcript_28829/m.42474 type:complete len:119 (+) Transcript_28829:2477-2833(+)